LYGNKTLRLDEVIAALLMNETRRSNNGLLNDGQVAMVTKKSSRRWGLWREKDEGSQCSRLSNRMFKCCCCDDEGHMRRNCLKKKKDLRDGKPSVAGVT